MQGTAPLSCGMTLPHLCVNVEKAECHERANLCPTEEELYNLCDSNYLMDQFADDPVVHATLITKHNQTNTDSDKVPVSFGLGSTLDSPDADAGLATSTWKAHAEAALYSSQHVVDWTERAQIGDSEL